MSSHDNGHEGASETGILAYRGSHKRKITSRLLLVLIVAGYAIAGAVAVHLQREKSRSAAVDAQMESLIVQEKAARLVTESQLAVMSKHRLELEERLTEATFYQGIITDAMINGTSGITLADDTGTIVWANNGVRKVFGYDRSELVGQPVKLLIGKQFQARHDKAYPLAKDNLNKTILVECDAARKDGGEFPSITRVKSFRSKANGRIYSQSITDPRDVVEKIHVENGKPVREGKL